MPPLRFSLLIVLLLFVAACTARSPRSALIPSPVDPERAEIDAQLERLAADPSTQLATLGEYHIGPGDELSISLLGRPDILGERLEEGRRFSVVVSESPTVTFPYIGAVRVHGKTADQLQAELAAAFSEYVREPIPIVTIEKYFQNQIAVLGTVREPGRYELELGDTLLEGIFRAGGLTFGGRTGGLAPGRYLKVYRLKVPNRERSSLSLDDLMERLTEGERLLTRDEIIIPIEEFLNSGELAWNIPLLPGDIVYIPPAGTVFVHGRVEHPGVTFLGPSLRTLSQVIGERGGLRISAHRRVEVLRDPPGEEPTSYYFNARRVLVRKDPDFLLQDGDQVIVYADPPLVFLEFLHNIFQTSIRAGASATYSPQ